MQRRKTPGHLVPGHWSSLSVQFRTAGGGMPLDRAAALSGLMVQDDAA